MRPLRNRPWGNEIASSRRSRRAQLHEHHPLATDTVHAMNRRPKPRIVAPSASPEEAAAIVAALERFMRESAPTPAPPPAPGPPAWARAGLLAGTGHEPS